MYTTEEKTVVKKHPHVIDSFDDIERDAVEFTRKLHESRTGVLEENEFKRFRLHRGIYGQRADQQGFNMIRVKLPGGVMTSNQLRQLAYIADEFADGVAHITTRQDIQFHWVKLETVPAVMRKLGEAGMTTREACGNAVRNIVGSAAAGVSADEAFDVSPYVNVLAKHLLRNNLTAKLPRKFKISFSGSENDRDGIIPWIHDIGYIALINDKGERGFKVFVGGGLGAHTRVADVFEEFLPEDMLIPLSEAIITIFDRHGDHVNRKRARMKYVLWKLGLHTFKKFVYEEVDKIFAENREFNEPHVYNETPPLHRFSPNGNGLTRSDDFELWKSANVFRQKQEGYNYIQINPVIGDLTSSQLLTLADITEKYSESALRATVSQDVIIRWVRSEDLLHLYHDLKKEDLASGGADSIANVTSCPGADTCQLGITYSRALGTELTAFFQKNNEWSNVLKDLRIKISGCPNSCGQHHVASIGFYGSVRKVKGRQVPHYLMLIGGGLHSGEAMYGQVAMKVPARRVTEAVMRIIKNYLSERNDGEDFWTYFRRIDMKSFKKSLTDLAYVPSYDDAPEWYVDLGQKTEFEVSTGDGECMV